MVKKTKIIGGYEIEVCESCGALVGDHDLHLRWHLQHGEARNRYVPPPRYGG